MGGNKFQINLPLKKKCEMNHSSSKPQGKYLLVTMRKDTAAAETFGGTFRLSLAPSSIVETVFFNYNHSTTQGKQPPEDKWGLSFFFSWQI